MKGIATVKIVRKSRVEDKDRLEAIIDNIQAQKIPTTEKEQKIAEAKADYSVHEPRQLVIRVVYGGEKRTYATGCDIKLTEEEFKSGRTNKAKDAIEAANKAAAEAKRIVNELGTDFSFPVFKKKFHDALFGDNSDKTLFSNAAQEYIGQLHEESRPHYRTAANVLISYYPNLRLKDITRALITDFRDKLLLSRTQNTANIYLREIRAIYNDAVDKKYVNDANPFRKLSLASQRRQKRVIKPEDLRAFVNVAPVTSLEQFAYDFFRLIVLLNAPNMLDIITLHNSDISPDNSMVSYCRHKTQHRDDEQIRAALNDEAIALLNKYGHIDHNRPDDYVLKFLRPGKSEIQIRDTNKRILKKVNCGIKSICDRLGIEVFKTYNIRHTVATSLKHNHFDAHDISKLFGHADVKTTSIYLSSLDSETVARASSQMSELITRDEES